MNTILVPTDFSNGAEIALDYAIAIAKKLKTKIILLHAFHVTYADPSLPGNVIARKPEQVKKESDEKLSSLIRKKSKGINVEIKGKSVEGFAVDEILSAAEKSRAGCIVMGTKGATGLKEILLGSNAAAVIEKAKCPVITVPEGAVYRQLKSITYATNYYAADVPALKQLVEIARPFGAEVRILHIADGEMLNEDEQEQFSRFVKKISGRVNYKKITSNLLEGKNTEKELEKYITGNKTGMLALSTRRRSLVEKLFSRGSIAKKLSFHTRVPLIAFHHRQESVVFI